MLSRQTPFLGRYLPYLLRQADQTLSAPFYAALTRSGVARSEWRVLVVLEELGERRVGDVCGIGKKVWYWESGFWYDGTIIWTQDITLTQPLMMTQAQISFYDENGDLSQRAMSRLYTFEGQGAGRFQSQTGNEVIPKFVPKDSTIGRGDPRLDPTITYWWPAEKLQKGGQVKVNGTWHNLILVNVYKGDRVDLVYADGKRDMVYPYDTYMFRWREIGRAHV